jgi:FAD/FMN-containing dehydrogenase
MAIIEELTAALGPDVVRSGENIGERNLRDWTLSCAEEDRPVAIVQARSTEDVAAALRICSAHRHPVVPQGGLTGLAGGATPVRRAVVVSLERMRAIEEVDTAAATITVQAGVPLQRVQEAAEQAGMLFPLDIGARGSCLIGGNISTNAGGNRVLRYGMARALVLGVEAVLADGTVLTSLNKMLKNNAGYDLKQLFIGSEGTLGIVTRLVLRLFPQPRSTCTALCALPDYDAVLRLLQEAKAELGPTLSAFEMMWPAFYRSVTDAMERRPPLPHGAGGYVLLEALGTDQARDEAQFSALVERMVEQGVVADAVIAQSIRESRELWTLRDASGELDRAIGRNLPFDVSIPVGQIDAFAEDCIGRLRARWPGVRAVHFGHIADANLHINVAVDETPMPELEIEEIVYRCVRDWHGSISAEHGIGLLKKPFLDYSRSEAEIAVMRRIKQALDPAGILNPGKIFSEVG